MARQGIRLFSAERNKIAQRGQDATMSEVLNAIRALETRIEEKISSQINALGEKLDVTVEEEKATPLEDIMAEIHAMNDHIATTKQEIAALKPADEANTTISAATA